MIYCVYFIATHLVSVVSVYIHSLHGEEQEILDAHCSAKFAYYLKSTRDHHFVTVSFSSDIAVNIQGQYENRFQYSARYHIQVYLGVSP